MNKDLIGKYNVPGPRYTSYPTVPYWDRDPNQQEWKSVVKNAFQSSNSSEGISLYIHLPYCERLCTYCGCNTRITVNHKVEIPYIDSLLKEWGLYLELFEEKPRISELHLGGGTPTFFSPENLEKLINGLLEKAEVTDGASFSFEAHPQNTKKEHLQSLYKLGFRRLSLGIQDFDLKVQKIINRVQTYEMVEQVTLQAREIGFDSVNFDLIYGLPLQTIDTVRDTFEKVNVLRPDRIAFYSYAHVPWVKPGQRSFTEKDLPLDEEKRALYELGKKMLEDSGYFEIGMDHFALKSDSLYQAVEKESLHRNFMGYTDKHTQLMVGLGASSISDTWDGFAQNIKKVEDYQQAVEEGSFPFYRGHLLNQEDLDVRRHILNLMCRLKTSWSKGSGESALVKSTERLFEMEKDGLIELSKEGIKVKEEGRAFVRNVCMTMDARLFRSKPETTIFSSTI